MADEKGEKKLNPNASAFKGALNPKAAPWVPSSFQASGPSGKPVVLIVGPPGVGKAAVGQELAKEFKAKYWSASSALREAQATAKKSFSAEERTGVLWYDTLHALQALDAMLKETKDSADIKGYVLDAQGRNTQQFFYLCNVLRKHKMSPGQVLHLRCDDDERLLKQSMAVPDASEVETRRKLQSYRQQSAQRFQLLNQAKNLVHEVDATLDSKAVAEESVKKVKTLFERPLAFNLPHAADAPCLSAIEDVEEYAHVANWVSTKISMGEVRWPCSQAAGQLKVKGGLLSNIKGEAYADPEDPSETIPAGAPPSSKTHVVSKKSDGTRYLLVHVPQLRAPTRGRFYLVPKHMEVVYTFKPMVAEQTFSEGEAPVYADSTGADKRPWSFAGDGELVKLKEGWGGLQGAGTSQWKFLLADLLYFEPEKERQLLARHSQWTLEKRLRCMRRLNWPEEDKCEAGTGGVALCYKVYFGMERTKDLADHVKKEADEYKTVGLTFTPTKKYLLWRDPQLVVWEKERTTFLEARKKEGTGGSLTLHDRSGAEKGEVSGLTEAQVLNADKQVCQVKASWEGDIGVGDPKWGLVKVRHDIPNGADDAGLKEYLSPEGWVPAELLWKQLSKVSMRVEKPKMSTDKPRMTGDDAPPPKLTPRPQPQPRAQPMGMGQRAPYGGYGAAPQIPMQAGFQTASRGGSGAYGGYGA